MGDSFCGSADGVTAMAGIDAFVGAKIHFVEPAAGPPMDTSTDGFGCFKCLVAYVAPFAYTYTRNVLFKTQILFIPYYLMIIKMIFHFKCFRVH